MVRIALLATLCACTLSAATITVTTTSMVIDVPGAAFIAQDPNGRTGLYDAATLNIASLPGTDGLISLPEAIIAANNTPGADTIVLGANTYTISAPNNYWYGPTGLPPITSEIIIEGNGAIIERSSVGGTPNFRLFFVMGPFHTGGAGKVAVSAGNLTLRNLTLRNGLARGGNGGRGLTASTHATGSGGGGLGAGGAVFSQGSLALDSCLLVANSAVGGSGATRKGTTSSNLAGGGGGIGANGQDGDVGGYPRSGGFFDSEFTGSEYPSGISPFGGNSGSGVSNNVGGGGFGPSDNGTASGGANGGGDTGLPNDNGGFGGAFGAGAFEGLGGGGGVGGGGSVGSTARTAGAGGFGGGGGGQCAGTISGGGGGNGGFGGGGGAGNYYAAVPFAGNNGLAGFGGGDGTAGGPAFGWSGGGAGMGGAVFNHTGTLTIVNCTFTQNSAIGGSSPDISTNGQGLGGALFNLNGGVLIVSSTLAGNGVSGGNLNHGGNLYSLAQHGKGVQDAPGAATVTIENSILVDASGNSNVAVLQGGHPFHSPAGLSISSLTTDSFSIIEGGITNLGATVTGTPVTTDPMLGALAANSGPTFTMLPAAGSPAINAGNNAAPNQPSRDQRGVARIKGGTVDVGSVETGANVAPVITAPASLVIARNTPHTFSATLSITDDAAFGASLQVILSATQGTVTLAQTTGLSFIAGDGTDDATMNFTGTLDAINAAFSGAQFFPPTGYLGLASLQLDVNDQGNTGGGGALTDSETVSIDVQTPNAPPVITAPGAIGTGINIAYTFAVSQISVSDPDAGAAGIELSLSVTNGTLTLGTIAGLSFSSGDGSADTAMVFTGTIADINAALTGMTFNPAAAYSGPATLNLLANDQGNTGAGGAQSDSHTINITVADLPEMVVLRAGVEVPHGGGDNAWGVAGTPVTRIYTIRNEGLTALNLGVISLANLQNCTANVSAAPASSVAVGSATTFTIDITPVAAGPFALEVHIVNDDADENPYSFAIVGTAVKAAGRGASIDDEACTTSTTFSYPVSFVAALLLFAARRRRHSARA